MSNKRTLVGLLVGVHFHPPGKLLLDFLPGEAELVLEPEPENPYDSNAIKVLVRTSQIPEDHYLAMEEIFPSAGTTLEQFLSEELFCLGHVGASTGKPLLKARTSWPELAASLTGNTEFLEAMKSPAHSAKLGFAPTGDPLVLLTAEDWASSEVSTE